MYRVSNPMYGDAYESAAREHASTTMTVEGTCLKTGLLLAIAVVAASISWPMVEAGNRNLFPVVIGAAIVAVIAVIVTSFNPRIAAITGPIYAAAKGLSIGIISALYAHMAYPGIVFQAVCLTFGVMFALLIAFQSGWIQVTEKFRAGVMAAVTAIFLVYLVSFVMSLCGYPMPYLHDNGPIGIGISVVLVIVSSLYLVLQFDFIDRGSRLGAPKYLEWYAALGMMVALAWLYLEILRLLSKLQSRR